MAIGCDSFHASSQKKYFSANRCTFTSSWIPPLIFLELVPLFLGEEEDDDDDDDDDDEDDDDDDDGWVELPFSVMVVRFQNMMFIPVCHFVSFIVCSPTPLLFLTSYHFLSSISEQKRERLSKNKQNSGGTGVRVCQLVVFSSSFHQIPSVYYVPHKIAKDRVVESCVLAVLCCAGGAKREQVVEMVPWSPRERIIRCITTVKLAKSRPDEHHSGLISLFAYLRCHNNTAVISYVAKLPPSSYMHSSALKYSLVV